MGFFFFLEGVAGKQAGREGGRQAGSHGGRVAGWQGGQQVGMGRHEQRTTSHRTRPVGLTILKLRQPQLEAPLDPFRAQRATEATASDR